MRVLVVGGAASGKSAYAERLAVHLAPVRTYVATMADDGLEAHARIERHRRQRASYGFRTIEVPDVRALSTCARDEQPGVMLLDDIGNLAAHALFAPDGTMADPTRALDALSVRLDALASAYDHAVVVGNLVGCEGPYPYEGTQAWVRLVGALCCRLAASFDAVVEVVAGVPLVAKGVDPLCR